MKDNETIIEILDEDEWYEGPKECQSCKKMFMADEPNFCPYCGKKIVGRKQGKETVYLS